MNISISCGYLFWEDWLLILYPEFLIHYAGWGPDLCIFKKHPWWSGPRCLWTISKKYSPTESSQALKKLLGIRSHVLKYIVSRERGLEVIDPTSSNPHHRNRRCKLSSQPELTYQQRLPSIPLTRIIPKTKIQVMSSTGHHASLIFSFQITPKGKNPPDKFGVFFLHHYLREHIYSI